jgi:hypothetical protein
VIFRTNPATMREKHGGLYSTLLAIKKDMNSHLGRIGVSHPGVIEPGIAMENCLTTIEEPLTQALVQQYLVKVLDSIGHGRKGSDRHEISSLYTSKG